MIRRAWEAVADAGMVVVLSALLLLCWIAGVELDE